MNSYKQFTYTITFSVLVATQKKGGMLDLIKSQNQSQNVIDGRVTRRS